jgi:hypothetical protein
MDADARVDVVRQQLQVHPSLMHFVARSHRVQALQQSFVAFALHFNQWRQRAFANCKAVFDRAAAEAAAIEFDDAQGLLR